MVWVNSKIQCARLFEIHTNDLKQCVLNSTASGDKRLVTKDKRLSIELSKRENKLNQWERSQALIGGNTEIEMMIIGHWIGFDRVVGACCWKHAPAQWQPHCCSHCRTVPNRTEADRLRPCWRSLRNDAPDWWCRTPAFGSVRSVLIGSRPLALSCRRSRSRWRGKRSRTHSRLVPWSSCTCWNHCPASVRSTWIEKFKWVQDFGV